MFLMYRLVLYIKLIYVFVILNEVQKNQHMNQLYFHELKFRVAYKMGIELEVVANAYTVFRLVVGSSFVFASSNCD